MVKISKKAYGDREVEPTTGIELCDECEFANRDKIAELESEHSKLKALFAEVRTDLALEKSDNAELRERIKQLSNAGISGLGATTNLIDKIAELKSRWEKLNGEIQLLKNVLLMPGCFDIAIDYILKIIEKKMHELESGGEVLKARHFGKTGQPLSGQPGRDSEGTPKPDSWDSKEGQTHTVKLYSKKVNQ
jgi:hypothetical protein